MIDEVLGVRARIRMILELYKVGETNTTDLARRLGLNYGQLERHLEVLAEAGIVEERRLGKRLRLVRLRKDEKITALAEALAELEAAVASRPIRAGS